MKNIRLMLNVWGVGLLLTSIFQCSSQKLVKRPPFAMGEVVYENWVSGIEGGGSGTNIYIPIQQNTAIKLDSIYFDDNVVKPEKIQKDTYLVYIGRFIHVQNKQEDMILHRNPEKEFGNKPPEITKKIPFKLKKDQAVVRYTENGKARYFSIENIKKSPQIRY